MDTINDGIRFLNRSIDACTDYIKENAIQLFIIGALLYYLKNRKQQDQGYTLSQSRPASINITPSTTSASVPSKNSTSDTTTPRSRDAHLLAVRERQQQLATERALEAAKLRKEKQEMERERKNNVAKEKVDKTKGDVLGGSDSGATCAYNPMQPWSGHSNGYRPARRTTRRG